MLLVRGQIEDKVYTYPLYGNITELGYYYTNIYIGTPPQLQSVLIDTGSGFVGVPCKSDRPNLHKDPFFDWENSSTFIKETCENYTINHCLCNDDKCIYYQVEVVIILDVCRRE